VGCGFVGVVYGPAEMTGGGIQMGVPTIVESTGGGEKGEQKESARTGQSVVGGGGLVGQTVPRARFLFVRVVR